MANPTEKATVQLAEILMREMLSQGWTYHDLCVLVVNAPRAVSEQFHALMADIRRPFPVTGAGIPPMRIEPYFDGAVAESPN